MLSAAVGMVARSSLTQAFGNGVMRTEIEVEVERLTNGPGALARAPDGRVVFLDRGLPGERVRVRVEDFSKMLHGCGGL